MSRDGLDKPFFKQVPLSDYEQQIRDMREIQHVSSTIRIHRMLRIKTIKQYIQMCNKIIKKKESRRKRKPNLNSDLMDVCGEAYDDSKSAAPVGENREQFPFNPQGPESFDIREQFSQPNLTSASLMYDGPEGKFSPSPAIVNRRNLAPISRKEKKHHQN